MARLPVSASDRNGRPPTRAWRRRPAEGRALLVLAAFSGSHGQLGVIPWMLQLPGILLVVYPPDGSFFAARVGAGALLQAGLWYTALRLIRRRRSRPSG